MIVTLGMSPPRFPGSSHQSCSVSRQSTLDLGPESEPAASGSNPRTLTPLFEREDPCASNKPLSLLPSSVRAATPQPRPRPRGRSKQAGEPKQPKQPPLACPFYKFDPRQHHECRYFVLRRVKDIKQHIQRKHPTLDTDPFPSRVCSPFQGITAHHNEKTKKYPARGKDIQDQWYDMWELIFPGHPRPKTIYLDNSREGRMRMLRRVWEGRKTEIMSSVSTIPGVPPANHESDSLWRFFDHVMETYLRYVDDDMSDDGVDAGGTVTTTAEVCSPMPPLPERNSTLDMNLLGDLDSVAGQLPVEWMMGGPSTGINDHFHPFELAPMTGFVWNPQMS